jgi:hypothetical protein
VGFVLDIIDKIKSSNLKMLKIWKHSATAMQGRDNTITEALRMDSKLQENLRRGGTRDGWLEIKFN